MKHRLWKFDSSSRAFQEQKACLLLSFTFRFFSNRLFFISAKFCNAGATRTTLVKSGKAVKCMSPLPETPWNCYWYTVLESFVFRRFMAWWGQLRQYVWMARRHAYFGANCSCILWWNSVCHDFERWKVSPVLFDSSHPLITTAWRHSLHFLFCCFSTPQRSLLQNLNVRYL